MMFSKVWIRNLCLCLQFSCFAMGSTPPVVVDGDNVICKDDNPALRASNYMTYSGCYNQTCFMTMLNFQVRNIDECTKECSNGSSIFAALSEGKMCYCGTLTCDTSALVCDAKCGVPCDVLGDPSTLIPCGGKGFFQVYKDKEGVTSPEKPDAILTMYAPITIGVVLIVSLGLTCYIAGMYGRRRKRRQRREQGGNQTIPAELTARRQRHQESRENIYSIASVRGSPQQNPQNISNGHSVSQLTLSSDNAYDHTSTLDRVRSHESRHQGFNSLPRRLPSEPRPSRSRHNPPAMQNVSEGISWEDDNGCNEFCCSEQKYGHECRCRYGRSRDLGNSISSRRPYANPKPAKGFRGSDMEIRGNARRCPLAEKRPNQEEKIRNDMIEISIGERGKDRRGESLQGSEELPGGSIGKREMLALPCDRETLEKKSSIQNRQLSPKTRQKAAPPIPFKQAMQEDGRRCDDSNAFYHTVHPENEKSPTKENIARELPSDGNPLNNSEYFTLEPSSYAEAPSTGLPSSNLDYFTLEPSTYSGTSSDIKFANLQRDGQELIEDSSIGSATGDQQYDYAAIPGQSHLRNLPCRCRSKPNQETEDRGDCGGMIDNVLYNP